MEDLKDSLTKAKNDSQICSRCLLAFLFTKPFTNLRPAFSEQQITTHTTAPVLGPYTTSTMYPIRLTLTVPLHRQKRSRTPKYMFWLVRDKDLTLPSLVLAILVGDIRE